ncbi:hypothetical protein Rsub_12619 [Raphidocelis subcapitata]|uniref:Cyclic nucleotide-binding domain-containing protein n=1 Tax=Raphidocelis subcapitata TaxID=307507 RepID=A0A2V0PJM7_9CHLO|nr:hypothetical protein Rsub_12619 [Raphidocelis subcapitata]|eukprot:GBF99926.1 hypothetical protein Rsub_12619 [Raphidocelis subcapitata]
MDLAAPLLGNPPPKEGEGAGDSTPHSRGRHLSISAIAPARRSSGSLRNSCDGDAAATTPRDARAAAAAPSEQQGRARGGDDAADAAPRRLGGLRFAPFPAASGQYSRPSSATRMSSFSSGAGGGGRNDAGGVLHRSASTKLQRLTAAYASRQALEAEEGFRMPPFVVHPYDIRAYAWWAFIAMAVLVAMAAEPFFLAFAPYPGLYPLTSPDTIVTSLLITAYALDIVLNFFLAYHDEDGNLVTDRGAIASHYCRSRLWLDLATTVPFDWVVLIATGLNSSDTVTARYISLLRLLRLGRAYRLNMWVHNITHNTAVSLFWVTMARNALVLFYTTHIGACLFFYLARQTEGAAVTWVVGARELFAAGESPFDGASVLGKYIFSLYWSAVTFATVGYGDIHAQTVPEAAFTVAFIYLNVFVGAYIIGTVTLLVTRTDAETGQYRSELAVLEAYSSTHAIPRDLQSVMRGHLRLHYSAQEASDERVLASLPTALRRRVLAHMYSGVLADSWLLAGVARKYLDALLGAAKMEHVMAKVEIVSEGDMVNELMILVAGTCVAEAPRGRGGGDALLFDLGDGSGSGGGGLGGAFALTSRLLGPGEPLAEGAFFTETPAMVTIRTTSVCRVLSLGRTAYAALAAAFPLSTQTLLGNLLEAAQEAVEVELGLPLDSAAGLPARELEAVARERAGAEAVAAAAGGRGGGGGGGGGGTEGAGRAQPPRMALSNLMLQQGLDVNSSDYDGRTALMLASGHGCLEAVRALLAAGADPSRADALQGCALLEAARGGHDAVLAELLDAGARLQMSEITCAAHLCTAVFEGDVPLLTRLLRFMDPDSGDYDGRRAAHIAAAESSLPALKVLVEPAGADLGLRDRWGLSPLDEARRGGAAAVVSYLEAAAAAAAGAAPPARPHHALGVSV